MRWCGLLGLCWLMPGLAADNTDVYAEVTRMHQQALAQHTYVTDPEQYGVADKWVASLTGDCEDYALYMQLQLQQHGYRSRLVIARTEQNQLHVVLIVKIAGVDYAIDNRFRWVYPKRQIHYKWLS